MPGAPSVPELFGKSVVRVSIGQCATLAARNFVREITRELRDAGTYNATGRTFYDLAEVEELLEGRREP